MTKKSQKVMTSKQEILDYLSISETLFTKFIKAGMPARFLDNRWYAHADNIDEWFRRQTLVSYAGADEKNFSEDSL